MPIWTPRGANYGLSEDQLKGLLKRYDTNGDGKLSKEELRAAFRQLGLRFSRWRAGRAIGHADANGDGYISEDELHELIKLYNMGMMVKTKESSNEGWSMEDSTDLGGCGGGKEEVKNEKEGYVF
ncbi:hypothetical protein LguiA_032976 [Lonicera macranthoides]